MADASAAPSYEEKKDGEETGSSFVKMWLDALQRSEAEEKDWRKKAEEVIETYRGKQKSNGRAFNILHSNVETICPALYNSTPAPDVRRRYADADPTGKVVADIVERALSFSIDTYDFDAVMKSVVKDGELTGRGVPRVRYVPTFGPATGPDGSPALDPEGAPIEEVVYEEVTCDYVPWRYFRRGPARTWGDVPWVAFGDFLTREALRELCGDALDKNGNAVAEQVPLNYTADVKDGDRAPGTQEQGIFRQALVWQVWDKERRRVVSICPDYPDAPLAMVDDPLGLSGFFPVPRPYQPILATDSLIPVIPYEIYEDLVLELNEITMRIRKLVKQLRPRGGYGGTYGQDMKTISEADDGELVPLTNVEGLMNGAGLDKAIVWFPLEMVVLALRQLVEHREMIKQVIYEVTGTSDILRGSTNAAETATAQQIKAQWGSLRIQDRQAEVARLARDLFRLKAEIIGGKFSWQILSQMTGIDVPDQATRDAMRQQIAQAEQQAAAQAGQQQPGAPGAPPMPPQSNIEIPEEMRKAAEGPSREEVEQVLRSDITRAYRIDVESDSTIRGDLTRNQQSMNLFLQGTAQYVAAMAPIVQIAPPKVVPVIIEVFTAFARQFKLGKQAEDALDGLSDMARKMADEPQQAPPPDPKLEAAKFQAEADIKATQLEMQRDEQKHAMEMQKMAAEQERDERKFALDARRQAMQERGAMMQAAVNGQGPAEMGAE